MVKSELVESWILYETNQGTDDHLQGKRIENVQPYQSVIITGTVSTLPRTIVGGHVIFSVKDKTGEIDCAAYEPTKEFRRIIRGLVIGDQLDVFGGVREQPLTVNIEKIHIKRLVSVKRKVENPVCPTCGKHMKSKGTYQGFKCRRCGSVSTKPRMVIEKRLIQPGSYEVPVCARRHLSKPLKRMKRKQYHEV
jgi:tRNA(Ile2)-agmatinylcytidine synthase